MPFKKNAFVVPFGVVCLGIDSECYLRYPRFVSYTLVVLTCVFSQVGHLNFEFLVTS